MSVDSLPDGLLYNKKLSITIQRGRHDKENPYVQISRKMLRDPDLSPKAKGILCYLLSLPDTWQVHPSQVAESMGIGKEQIYTILNELLKKGYALKKNIKCERGRFGGILYEFFEDKLAEEERFKEVFTNPGNPDTGNPDAGNPTIRNKDSRLNRSRSSLKVPDGLVDDPEKSASLKAAKAAEVDFPNPPISKKKEFAQEVKDVTQGMIDCLSLAKPDYNPPKNLNAFMNEVDFLIRIDKRQTQKIFDVFNWALGDSFWADKMFKPNPAKYLREKFDQLEMKMNAKPPKNQNEVDRRLRDKEGKVVDAYKDEMF